ncbi:hypothetical protein tinsulaeT_33750 [Thalassotalea insulae]|uniref:Nuclear transport factor 2 family protein n=1 Tax=Thalassotalea insulae TaxID=2056778 RepID=A0ABQ6GZX5_9GAMM|nr:hypothetical protein [Thalassotalea insulae]GLX80035.1 hypothetical protein tinsulaeT_33750 [Thalassotalea insulae]
MKKTLTLSLLMLCTLPSVANQHQAAIAPITNLFDAMRAHNGAKLIAQFSENAKLERITKENNIHPSDLTKFADFVSQSNKYLDEQLLDIQVLQSGNLASAWTPFAFYLDGKLSHCGVNSFQLIKQDKQWKIQYLIDNVYQGDCEQFIKQYQKE